MKKAIYIIIPMALFFSGCQKETDSPQEEGPKEISIESSVKQLVVTEQSTSSIIIFDQPTRKELWRWSADADSSMPASHCKWFDLPDEAKPVDNCSSILLTASGGGVALVRISDSKLLFYAHPSGNPHSAEILPEGYIVVASSTGNSLTVYKMDQSAIYVKEPACTATLEDAHACVWDKKRQCLWTAGGQSLVRWGFSGGVLSEIESVSIPSLSAHDLIPVYGQDLLMLSTGSNLYYFNPETGIFSDVEGASITANIKSISTGPAGFTTICTTPEESWYTREVLSLFTGIRAFYLAEAEIYKARWRVNNDFSY